MIGDVLSSASGRAGRPKGPKKQIEEVLTAFVKYRAELRAAHKGASAETRSGFKDTVGLSDQGLRDYLKNANLPWPLLPADETALVCVIWGEAPFDITWANTALSVAQQCLPSDLIGHGCALPLLRGRGAHLEPEQLSMIQRLRTDRDFSIAQFSTELLRADGKWQPVDVHVRYAGPVHNRFYCVAELAGPARSPAKASAETLNVCQDRVYKWHASVPVSIRAVNGLVLTPPVEHYVMTPSGLRLNVVAPDYAPTSIFMTPSPSLTFNPSTSTIVLDNGSSRISLQGPPDPLK